ncbi:MAG: SEC-C metal-binding domain-containing protein [Acidobacteriota bacterium]
MTKKIGRNEPCPCGSGKKYKKCCGPKEHPAFGLPADLRTGTPLDDYMLLYEVVAICAQGIAQFEADGKILKKVEAELEKKLRPGEENGISLSLFMSWLHFDFRFGRSRETVVERFLRSTHASRLLEPGPTHLGHFARSYCAWYEILEVHEDRIDLAELGTGVTWRVFRVNEPSEKEAKAGQIWYLRLLGPPAGAYIFTPPYIYPPEAKEWLTAMTAKLEEAALDDRLQIALTRKDLFVEACKANVPNWAFVFLGRYDEIASLRSMAPAKPHKRPILLNTDGQLLSPTRVFFKVKDRDALKEGLSALDGFEYDAHDKDWTWMRRTKKQARTFGKMVIARLRLRGDRLIAEVNSLERATELIGRLTVHLGAALDYEKTESRSVDSFPEPTEEELRKHEEEQRKLYSQPEIRAAIEKQHEDYYLTEWIRTKVPALDGLTPLAAVGTEEGRRRVETLLDDFEDSGRGRPDYEPRFDFDRLRRRLGLAPRKH